MWEAICNFFNWMFSWLTDDDNIQSVQKTTALYANVLNMVNADLGFR